MDFYKEIDEKITQWITDKNLMNDVNRRTFIMKVCNSMISSEVAIDNIEKKTKHHVREDIYDLISSSLSDHTINEKETMLCLGIAYGKLKELKEDD